MVRRFGNGVLPWLDALPGRLVELSQRWNLELDGVIPKGSMSVVLRCRTAHGQRAVLKISPDRERVALEIAGLDHWATSHVPTVLHRDPALGALVMEEIEPGTALQESGAYPDLGDLGALLAALHTPAPADLACPSVLERVSYLFDTWARERQSDAAQVALVSPELFERGRRLAVRLASEPTRVALLHSDFTPANILDGGPGRGLVAIDPAPTLGDAAFDAVDLLCWQADDLDTLVGRAETLGAAIGVQATRLLDWCTAFGGMTAQDLVGPGQRQEPPGPVRDARVHVALDLADQAPR